MKRTYSLFIFLLVFSMLLSACTLGPSVSTSTPQAPTQKISTPIPTPTQEVSTPTPIPPTAIPTLTATPTSSATPAADPLVEIDGYLTLIANQKLFSGTVLVAKDGKVLIDKGYGMADQELKTPVTLQTRFLIYSMTKQFTAMAILMLQNQGKLSVQDPLCSYLKSCPEAWKPITLRQLLTHTSGVPDLLSIPDYGKYYRTSMTPGQLADWFQEQPLDFPPGEKFNYSNSGYDLLGYVIEQVSGQPYAAFLKQAIFDPLDMKDTGYDPEPKGLATGYADYSRDYKGDSFDLSVAYAAAGLYSTVGDLYKWDQALYTEALLPQSQLAEMFKAQVDLDPGGYGYGWFVGTVMGHRAELHSGGWYGFSSNITRFPDDKITFIILSNNQVAALDIIEGYIAARILK